jgi:hypothetical protein
MSLVSIPIIFSFAYCNLTVMPNFYRQAQGEEWRGGTKRGIMSTRSACMFTRSLKNVGRLLHVARGEVCCVKP